MGDIGTLDRHIVILSANKSKSRSGAPVTTLVRLRKMWASRVLMNNAPEGFENSRMVAEYTYRYRMHRIALNEENYIGDAGVVYNILGVNEINRLFIEVVASKNTDMVVPTTTPAPTTTAAPTTTEAATTTEAPTTT